MVYARVLVERHLVQLSRWNLGLDAEPASLGADLVGKLDLSQVAFVGHSRGSQLSPSANSLESLEPLGHNAFSGLNGKYLGITGTCDADGGYGGMQNFDVATQLSEANARLKAAYYVFGANHNFFSTEWQHNEPLYGGCFAGVTALSPPLQRQSAVDALIPAVLANVGTTPEAALNRTFDPLYKPSVTFPRIERSYVRRRGTSSSPTCAPRANREISRCLEQSAPRVRQRAQRFEAHHHVGALDCLELRGADALDTKGGDSAG
jgi:hypothetical protein